MCLAVHRIVLHWSALRMQMLNGWTWHKLSVNSGFCPPPISLTPPPSKSIPFTSPSQNQYFFLVRVNICFSGCRRVSIQRVSPTTLLSDTKRDTKLRWIINLCQSMMMMIIPIKIFRVSWSTTPPSPPWSPTTLSCLSSFRWENVFIILITENTIIINILINHHSVMPDLVTVRE